MRGRGTGSNPPNRFDELHVELDEEARAEAGPTRYFRDTSKLADLVILTRDPWMHRLDLARATGREPVLTADHDGVIVADIVAEWARRHGRPYRLELTGPAGGSWSSSTGGEEIVMDAADFCRVISGRPSPDGGRPSGLLTTQVPF